MSPDLIAALISVAGVFVSLLGSAFITGVRWGTVKTRLDILEKTVGYMATKDQLAGIKEDVAEIKGMFRMTLRDGKDV